LIGAEALREEGILAGLPPGALVLEIGFGRAEALIEMARAEPRRLFVGVEVSRKRAHKAARRVERAGLANVRVVHGTAEYLLSRALPDSCVSECWINFPDPWPKKRHHKRRLVRPEVVKEIARVLEPGACLHVATDHDGYAAWIGETLAGCPALENLHAPAPCSERGPQRPGTLYERNFLAEGRRIAYFEYRRRRALPGVCEVAP
jgi:tRNA (guanine-N7-)-methyltransferase